MHPDLDDTRVIARGSAVAPATDQAALDLDDTVVRVPDLVEPPASPSPVIDRPRGGRSPVPAPTRDSGVRSRSTDGVPAPVPRLAIRGGETVPLDAPVLVGRRPSVPRIRRGPEPRLVTVPSPSKEISATHLMVRMHGSAIVVSDLRSTNGTVVTLPGSHPRTLLRGESAVVVAGTIVGLGDGVVVDILPAEAP